ncbi:MAG: 2-amino-4-hydroxy-6-hydroxymethyldihydropteridine diphosphokinase [Planctomycetota bacterium]|nr:2-amino-4-hydroxy-6-hydroxymethyldihydropteridine diphosphokinase [Planctomycetota bacterium]
MKVTVALSLGSNLGNRSKNIVCAIKMLSSIPMTKLLACSRIYETAPVGSRKKQPYFLNACILLRTHIPPYKLLKYSQAVEKRLGRKRKRRWCPRSIDVDILLYGKAVLKRNVLEVPHPRMCLRRFVLHPLCEIAPFLRHPEIGLTVAELARMNL